MPCNPDELRHVPLFELLDDDEAQILAAQVEIRQFAPRQRIFKAGDPAGHGYVMMSGSVSVTTMDEDQQEVLLDEPAHGDFFGFASCWRKPSTRPPRWRQKRRHAWRWGATT